MDRPPIHPWLTGYAILLTVFMFLLLFKGLGWLDWSWWWVSLPLWIVPAGYLVFGALIFFAAGWRVVIQRLQPRTNGKDQD